MIGLHCIIIYRWIYHLSLDLSIITNYKEDLKKHFSNTEIFNIFKDNKRILLFLIEEKIIIFDEYIIKKITTGEYLKYKYIQYFAPELRPFRHKKWFPQDKKLQHKLKIKPPSDFNELRKKGQNDKYICKLIQNDSVKEFISYVNANDISLNMSIPSSIYETNFFLLKHRNTKLIQYAAFYGAIQIFKYLQNNKVQLTSSVMTYAIHANNAEMIQIFENNQMINSKNSYNYLIKSIKCHHIDIANYLMNNYPIDDVIINPYFKYYNFIDLDLESIKSIDSILFTNLCLYDYPILVCMIVNTDINLNERIIVR